MPTGIKGQFPHVFRVAFELKYNFGFTYLDRCGRTVNLILREHPEWILANAQPNPQNAPLVSTRNSCRFNFSAERLDLSILMPLKGDAIAQEDLDAFYVQTEQLTSIVVDQLSLDDFSRLGCRIWWLVPFAEKRQAEAWLRGLDLFTISPSLLSSFGGEVEDVVIGVGITSTDRKFRIGLEVVERAVAMDLGDSVFNIPPHKLKQTNEKGKKGRDRLDALVASQRVKKVMQQNQPFGVMIDVDASQEEPEVIHAGEFVKSSFGSALDKLRQAIG
jgi:hypothetical protein